MLKGSVFVFAIPYKKYMKLFSIKLRFHGIIPITYHEKHKPLICRSQGCMLVVFLLERVQFIGQDNW